MHAATRRAAAVAALATAGILTFAAPALAEDGHGTTVTATSSSAASGYGDSNGGHTGVRGYGSQTPSAAPSAAPSRAPSTSPSSPSSLPNTGPSTSGPIRVGLGLVTIGGLALAGSRIQARRRGRHSQST